MIVQWETAEGLERVLKGKNVESVWGDYRRAQIFLRITQKPWIVTVQGIQKRDLYMRCDKMKGDSSFVSKGKAIQCDGDGETIVDLSRVKAVQKEYWRRECSTATGETLLTFNWKTTITSATTSTRSPPVEILDSGCNDETFARWFLFKNRGCRWVRYFSEPPEILRIALISSDLQVNQACIIYNIGRKWCEEVIIVAAEAERYKNMEEVMQCSVVLQSNFLAVDETLESYFVDAERSAGQYPTYSLMGFRKRHHMHMQRFCVPKEDGEGGSGTIASRFLYHFPASFWTLHYTLTNLSMIPLIEFLRGGVTGLNQMTTIRWQRVAELVALQYTLNKKDSDIQVFWSVDLDVFSIKKKKREYGDGDEDGVDNGSSNGGGEEEEESQCSRASVEKQMPGVPAKAFCHREPPPSSSATILIDGVSAPVAAELLLDGMDDTWLVHVDFSQFYGTIMAHMDTVEHRTGLMIHYFIRELVTLRAHYKKLPEMSYLDEALKRIINVVSGSLRYSRSFLYDSYFYWSVIQQGNYRITMLQRYLRERLHQIRFVLTQTDGFYAQIPLSCTSSEFTQLLNDYIDTKVYKGVSSKGVDDQKTSWRYKVELKYKLRGMFISGKNNIVYMKEGDEEATLKGIQCAEGMTKIPVAHQKHFWTLLLLQGSSPSFSPLINDPHYTHISHEILQKAYNKLVGNAHLSVASLLPSSELSRVIINPLPLSPSYPSSPESLTNSSSPPSTPQIQLNNSDYLLAIPPQQQQQQQQQQQRIPYTYVEIIKGNVAPRCARSESFIEIVYKKRRIDNDNDKDKDKDKDDKTENDVATNGVATSVATATANNTIPSHLPHILRGMKIGDTRYLQKQRIVLVDKPTLISKEYQRISLNDQNYYKTTLSSSPSSITGADLPVGFTYGCTITDPMVDSPSAVPNL